MGETNFPTEAPQQQSDAGAQSVAARIRSWLFGFVSSALLRLLGATWRIEILGLDPRRSGGAAGSRSDAVPRPQLAALFHESMLPCAWFFRDLGYSVAVSRSRDGDLIRATLLGLGYSEPARGSSSRGGTVALRGLVRRLDEGTTVAVLVDGPRGPARVAKTGILFLAQRTGTPIQPVAFSARPAVRLRSWDRSLVPLPFARVVCAFGEPLDFETDGDESREQAAARRLDEQLAALHHEADRILLSR
jgi:lysophospholipid acyltransferase (LPLAT)-like uncharacterized protein